MKIIISKGKVTILETGAPGIPASLNSGGGVKSFDKIVKKELQNTKRTEGDKSKALDDLQKQILALTQQVAQVNPNVDPNKPPKPGEKPTPQKATEPPKAPPRLDPARAEQERKAAEAAAKNNPAQRSALGKAVTSLSAALAMRPK